MQLRSAVLVGILATAGCATWSHNSQPIPLREGPVQVRGVVAGKQLDGVVQMDDREMIMESNLGVCRRVFDRSINWELVRRGRSMDMGCSGIGMNLSLRWTPDGEMYGEASIPVRDTVRKQGNCIRYDKETEKICQEYAFYTEEVTRWVSAPIVVRRIT